jgi:hypothetical protein
MKVLKLSGLTFPGTEEVASCLKSKCSQQEVQTAIRWPFTGYITPSIAQQTPEAVTDAL